MTLLQTAGVSVLVIFGSFVIVGILMWPKKPVIPIKPDWRRALAERDDYCKQQDFALCFLAPGLLACVVSIILFVCGTIPR